MSTESQIRIAAHLSVEEFVKLYGDSEHVRHFNREGIVALLTRLETDQSESPEEPIDWTGYFIDAMQYDTLAELIVEQVGGSSVEPDLVEKLTTWLTLQGQEASVTEGELVDRLSLALENDLFKFALTSSWGIELPIVWSDILKTEDNKLIYLT